MSRKPCRCLSKFFSSFSPIAQHVEVSFALVASLGAVESLESELKTLESLESESILVNVRISRLRSVCTLSIRRPETVLCRVQNALRNGNSSAH